MSRKPIVPRERANQDIDETLAHYLRVAGEAVAFGFVDALEQAFAHIVRHPGAGARRWAHELNLPGLQVWQLTRYPQLVFYVERPDHVDVWRVLHGARDIPASMQWSDDTTNIITPEKKRKRSK